MSEEKKYVTFRDLRVAANKAESTPATEPTTTSIPSSSSISSTPSTSSIPSASSSAYKPVKARSDKSLATAPERDFQRIPNSVTRQAIPEGLFRGKSKQVWDYLWSVSRGAVVPTRTVRKSRREIKSGAGLGSMVTVDAALEHLQQVGLIAVKPVVGSLVGNEYEVFTPEESYTSISSTPRYTSPTQKVDILDILESSISSITQTTENTGTYAPPKTSFKTKEEIDDDDAFAACAEVLREVSREITGKSPSSSDSARWREVGEVLAAELRIAAARTTVSSAPSFLAEHLRRRLWKMDKKQATAEGRELPDEKTPAPSSEKAKDCPDCGGSGFWYPEGYEKGVAKCPHSKLTGA